MGPLGGAYGKVMREMAGDILSGSNFRSLGLFDPAAIDGLLAEFPDPSFLVGKQIMSLLMFGLWHEGVVARA